MAKIKYVRIILMAGQDRWSIKVLKKLGVVRVVDYGGSKLSVIDLRLPSLY